jgi:uncharacterized cupin superfamily protein
MKKFDNQFINVSKISEEYFDEKYKIGGVNANFSKYFDLKRVGVHYFKVPSGYRTSQPHAESLEEEFVFVINGEIDLWFNGKIKKMKKGDCIGFPAGTGVGHTFINNSPEDVEIFVAGDRTKADNQYHFHLNPDMKDVCGIKWWDDIPPQILGGHEGIAGQFDPSFTDNEIFTFNGHDNIEKANWSYPEDDETFSDGVCLSRQFNLTSIAVWLEKIPSGKRTSWPHAHSVEEEFVFMLSDGITVWLDNIELESHCYDAVDFKAGSGIAHTLINKKENDLYYICVGECEPVNDKIYYPLHPKRNKEIREKGSLWEEMVL